MVVTKSNVDKILTWLAKDEMAYTTRNWLT
jgi:hypothetical protein